MQQKKINTRHSCSSLMGCIVEHFQTHRDHTDHRKQHSASIAPHCSAASYPYRVDTGSPPTRQAVLPKRWKGLSCPCGKTTRWCLSNFLVRGKFDKSKIATQVAYVDAFFSVGCTLASCEPRRLPFVLTVIPHFHTASLKYEAPSDVRENGGGQQ